MRRGRWTYGTAIVEGVDGDLGLTRKVLRRANREIKSLMPRKTEKVNGRG
jgi:hypothetical protein